MAAAKPGVERLLERIESLVVQRQELRARGARGRLLERNRRRIAHAQWELSRALIERHRPQSRRAA
jgi:hypothetical protein